MMPEATQYKRIAERYVQAGLNNSGTIQEACGFSAYHAFESIGAAWITHMHRRVPKGHASKLRDFVNSSDRSSAHSVAFLASLLESLRSRMLYPSPDGIAFKTPENTITNSQATDLLRRVNGIVRRVSSSL